MTLAQRDAVDNPAQGLMVYCTDCVPDGDPEYYNGLRWKTLTAGVTLPTVLLCSQQWSASNLNVSTYRNGDSIPQVTDLAEWLALTTGAWCYYNNDPANEASYGKLYNWYAVNDPRGLAPLGWHIPSDAEWAALTDCLGGAGIAGGKMKTTTLWEEPNTAASNSSGFTATPAGNRYNDGFQPFSNIGFYSIFWSTTDAVVEGPWTRGLSYSNGGVFRNQYAKADGFSIRCVRD